MKFSDDGTEVKKVVETDDYHKYPLTDGDMLQIYQEVSLFNNIINNINIINNEN